MNRRRFLFQTTAAGASAALLPRGFAASGRPPRIALRSPWRRQQDTMAVLRKAAGSTV